MKQKIFITALLCFLLSVAAMSQNRNLLTGHCDMAALTKTLVQDNSWIGFPPYNDRERWNEVNAVYRSSCIKQGEQLLNYTWQVIPATVYLEFVRSGDRVVMEKIRDRNFHNLKMLVLAELCEGKGRFMNQIADGVWALCETTTWALSAHLGMQKAGPGLPDVEEPVIDLFAGNTGTLLAWTHYFFKDEFDKINPLLAKRIRLEINRRILEPFYRRTDFSWMSLDIYWFVNNWNIWVNSNMLNCLLLMETDPHKKAEGVYKTMQSVDRFINHYKPDGACEEGPMYWFRAGGNLYQYLSLLSKATRGNIRIFDDEVIKNIGRYILRAYITDDYYINFADAAARITTDPGLVYRYGAAVNDTTLQTFGSYLAWHQHWDRQLMDNETLELFIENMYDASAILVNNRTPSFSTEDWFADNQIVIARDDTNPGHGFYFSAKGGDNSAGHSHNDVGSCILFYDGNPVLIDVGRGVYNAQTFSDDRYAIWNNRTAWHNLPVINGVEQKHGDQFSARNVIYNSSPDAVSFSLDIAGAYPDDAFCKKWIRSYQFIRNKSFSIEDRYELLKNTGETAYSLITPCTVKNQSPGNLLLQTSSGALLEVNYKKSLQVTVEPVTLTDTVMLHSWPPVISRIIFKEGNKALKGSNSITVKPLKADQAFYPAMKWLDNNGVHINAHGGGILYHNETYYWFGEHKIAGQMGNIAMVGVGCYSSKDLYNWKNEGIALKVEEDPASDIAKGCILERPKVIYNAKTKKFVMWFHLELKDKGYNAARSAIAVSDNPAGPYVFLKSFRPNAQTWPFNFKEEWKRDNPEYNDIKESDPLFTKALAEGLYIRRDFQGGQMARDMTLFVDDNGKAYHIYASEENYTLHIAELADDYLSYTGKWVTVDPGGLNEAPAICKKDGKYYLITSGCTGWSPNAARSFVSNSIWGPWKPLGNPCKGDDAELTYHSQGTYILPVAGKKNAFIFMADRWNPDDAIDGRYIWLSLLFNNGKPELHWLDKWTLN